MHRAAVSTWVGARPADRRRLTRYWRTTKGAEVDFVIEWCGGVVAVEVKASNRVTTGDARHLRAFLDEYRDLARGELILYTGDGVQRISREILAAPWWLVV